MMALSGVRSSWLILARNCDLARLALSACVARVRQIVDAALDGVAALSASRRSDLARRALRRRRAPTGVELVAELIAQRLQRLACGASAACERRRRCRLRKSHRLARAAAGSAGG